MITALLIGAGAYLLLRSRRKNTTERAITGIGAAKRRIYKELSLAQKAGVDFEKQYDELTEDEIQALQQVSADTGYTETYYKSLQKAYNAISGLGATYDVVNADGDTILTWTDDPQAAQIPLPGSDDQERYRALREAHEIEDERAWAETDRMRRLEDLEARTAEQRRRLRKAGRTSQMALFGLGTINAEDALEPELLEYVRQRVDDRRMSIAYDQIDEMRCPLSMAEPTLYDNIVDLVEEWCLDNAVDPDSIWELFDAEDIFWAL